MPINKCVNVNDCAWVWVWVWLWVVSRVSIRYSYFECRTKMHYESAFDLVNKSHGKKAHTRGTIQPQIHKYTALPTELDIS